MKKIIVILLFLIVLSTICYGASFTDLSENHWAYNNVSRLVDYGIISGYQDGSFKPSNPITRAEFAKMVVLTLDLSGVEDIVFTDIEDHWANNYINIIGNDFYNLETSTVEIKDQWAYDYRGIIINKKLFKPDEHISRADAVYAIIHALDMSNETINTSEIGEFSDVIDNWVKNSAYIAKKNGFIKGDEQGNFNANKSLTRAEVVTILCNIIDKLSIDTSANYLKLVELINPSPIFSRTSEYPESSSIYFSFNDVILSAELDVLDDSGKSHKIYQMGNGGDFMSIFAAIKPEQRYRVVCKNLVTVNGTTKKDKEYVISIFTPVDKKTIIDKEGEFNIVATKIPDQEKLKLTYKGSLPENYAIRLSGMSIKEYDKPGYGGRVYDIVDDTIDLKGAYSLMDMYGIPRYDKTVLYKYTIIGPSKNSPDKYETIETKSFEYHIEGQNNTEDDNRFVNLDSIILKGVSSGFEGIEYGTDNMEIEFSDSIESIDVDVLNSSNESVLISKYISGKTLKIVTSRNPGKYTLQLKNYIGKDGKKTKKDLVYSYPFEFTGKTSVYTSNDNDPLDVELDIEKPLKVYSKITPKFNKALKPKQVVYMKISTDYDTGFMQKYDYYHNFWGILYAAKERGEYIYGQNIKVTVTVLEENKTVLEKSFDILIPKEMEAEAKEKGI